VDTVRFAVHQVVSRSPRHAAKEAVAAAVVRLIPVRCIGAATEEANTGSTRIRSVTYAVVAATTGSHKSTLRQQVQKLATCQCQRKGGR
jgi:hypothetical protein